MAKRKKPRQRKPRLSPAQRAEQSFEDGKVAIAVGWAKNVRLDESNEDSIDDLWVAGKILAQAGENHAAIALFQQLSALDIQDKNLRVALACCYAKIGDASAALATLDPTSLSQDSNLAFACSLADGGCLTKAIEVLEKACRIFPSAIELEVELARFCFENSDMQRAQEILEGVLKEDVRDAHLKSRAWFNLGELHSKNHVASEAEQAYRNAIQADAGFYKPWINLAVLLRDDARHVEAIQILRDAAQLFPENDKLNYLLAFTLRLNDQFDQAIEVLRGIVDRSTYAPAWEMLGRCLTEVGNVGAAIDHYKRWLSVESKNPVAAHMLSALQGEETPGRASASYITRVFDDFADTFESSYEKIGYCGPAAMAQILEQNLSAPAAMQVPARIVLDAGCGTGLIGPVLRGYAGELIGVDLSSEMLAKAKQKLVYDRLVCGDLETVLSENAETYDLIVAADTFNYFGDLSALIPMCFAALRQKGWLVFSLEEGPMAGDHFYLQPHGRYVHAPQYIMEQLGECGIEGGSMNRVALRKEAGKDVFALLVAAQKPDLEPEPE
jgi:predicted TPR repeat methyltransferase/thioredoxin-like negative regulator of GroEL